jgi:hypothetical protein
MAIEIDKKRRASEAESDIVRKFVRHALGMLLSIEDDALKTTSAMYLLGYIRGICEGSAEDFHASLDVIFEDVKPEDARAMFELAQEDTIEMISAMRAAMAAVMPEPTAKA